MSSEVFCAAYGKRRLVCDHHGADIEGRAGSSGTQSALPRRAFALRPGRELPATPIAMRAADAVNLEALRSARNRATPPSGWRYAFKFEQGLAEVGPARLGS